MGRRSLAQCVRDCGQRGTFYHVLWECTHIQRYWAGIQEIIDRVLGGENPLDPKLAILNIWSPTDLTRPQRTWLSLALMVAKRNIARMWGGVDTPQIQDWENDLDWCQLAEKTTYESRGCPEKWSRVWGRWNEYRGYTEAEVGHEEG